MKITEVRITKYEAGALKAFASITIDDMFVVDGLKVLDKDNDLFVAMPSKKTQNGKFKNTAFPIKKEAKENIIKAVKEAYKKA